MATKENETKTPDQVILNNIQQQRLAMLSDLDKKEISGKNVIQLADELKWKTDPRIFLFRKICGKVVKKDPVTGIYYPVPFATVYIEDTDCNLLVYHPPRHPWSWHFPYFCKREVIATTHTDACGNFCVWIPRFDIDWILRWRRERICFPVIFRRPILKDIINKFHWPPVPNPPNPRPWEINDIKNISASILDSIGGSGAEILKKEISKINNSAGMGETGANTDDVLNTRLFDREMPPPLPVDFQQALSGNNVIASKGASATDAISANIATSLGLNTDIRELEGFDINHFIGPFYRCIDIQVPVWQIVKDVPDITFRVTQDTNGDGTEETIYSEGYFDVRWNSGAIPNVTLVASSIARESRICRIPPVACGNVPDLLFAGFMPLRNGGYFDDNAGYALRPNRPKPSGQSTGASIFPANTPFCGALQLYGCADLLNAKYYRIQQSIDNGASYAAITGLSWNNYLSSSLPIPISADIDGWYPVEPINPVTLSPVPRASLEFSNLLLDWPTPANEKNLLKIELGDSSKTHLSESAPVAIVSDNTVPTISLTNFSWKYSTEPDASFRSLIEDCPMIKRGAVPKNIQLIFEVSVSASHLRDASLSSSGCGGGSFLEIADVANEPAHWHQTVFDNSEVLHQRYELNATDKPGCYSFGCLANSRSMNPSGLDGGNLLPSPDWFYNPVYLYSQLIKSVAIVNEDLI